MAVTPGYNALQLIAPSPGTGEGVGGSIMKAPLGTALPTGTGASINSAFVDLGYCDENGIKDKEERRHTPTFAWGGGLVGDLQQSYSRTMTIKFLQYVNPNVLTAAYGSSNVTVTAATSSTGTEVAALLNSLLLDTLSWCFQGFYRTAAVLKVIPIGRIVDIGDTDFTHKAFTTVTATLLAFPDPANNHGYLYTNDGVTTLMSGS
jgi:hypothetical protein